MLEKKIKQIFLVLLFLVLFITIIQPLPLQAQTSANEYVFRRSWGGEGDEINYPGGIAIGLNYDSGELPPIIVANSQFHRLTFISQDDRTFNNLGSYGYESGAFNYPSGIEINKYGEIYVCDWGNARIQKFSSDGDFITAWGREGSAPGQFNRPEDIAIDSLGNVYVTDRYNNRIQKFLGSGAYILEWGTEGSGPGQFVQPSGVAVDKNDFVYVTDGQRVQVFNNNGIFLRQWEIKDSQNNLHWANDVIVNGLDEVYIVDSAEGLVMVFDKNGVFIRSFGGGNQLNNPLKIAIDSKNNVYVASGGIIQKFNRLGEYLTSWGKSLSLPFPHSIAGDVGENVFVLTTSSIEKFTNSGSFLLSFGEIDSGEGQLDYPARLAVSEIGTVYASNVGSSRVQKYTNNGGYLGSWGSYGSAVGEFNNPGDILVWENGNISVADIGNHRIQTFSSAGNYLETVSVNLGMGNTMAFLYGTGITADDQGNLFFIDEEDYIRKTTKTGTFITRWGQEGDPNTPFDFPGDIEIDRNGNLLVTIINDSAIQVFSTTGTYLGTWGSEGNRIGEFLYPDSLGVDARGNVIVTDTYNNRVQVFSLGLPDEDPNSGLILNGNFEYFPALTEWAYGGSLPVSQSTHSYKDNYALLLGQAVPAVPQDKEKAWAHQTFYVYPEWDRPVLSFKYNMFVNDIMDYSDFFVEIQDGVGLNHLATVVHDGYQPCTPGVAPLPGTDLGWRTVSYDLSAYKGQHIRLVFSNRNLHINNTNPIYDSLGIWTYLDDVRVNDAGKVLPGSHSVFLPMLTQSRCDPVPAASDEINSIFR